MYVPLSFLLLVFLLLAPLYFVAWRWWSQERARQSIARTEELRLARENDRIAEIEQASEACRGLFLSITDALVLESPFEARASATEDAREKLLERYHNIEDFYAAEGDDEEEWMSSDDVYEAAEINSRNARAMHSWLVEFKHKAARQFLVRKGNWDEMDKLFQEHLESLNLIALNHEDIADQKIDPDLDSRIHTVMPTAQAFVEATSREMFDSLYELAKDVGAWARAHELNRVRNR